MYRLFLSVMIMVVACNKENHTIPNGFPNQVGNHWVYRFSGYPQNTDSIVVDITSTVRLPNGEPATVWVTRFANFTDTSYVSSSPGEVVFYFPPCYNCIPSMPAPRFRYVFPLQVGNQWFVTAGGNDTIKVLSQASIQVGKGFDAYVLSRTRQPGGNSYTRDTLWFMPGVGMIKLHRDAFNLGPLPGNGVWELASYSLR